MLRTIGDWSSLAVLIAVLVYTTIYFTKFPWRSTILTRIFATKNLLVVLFSAQIQASIWLGSAWFGRDWIRLAVNVLCSAAYIALAAVMLWMQNRERAAETAMCHDITDLVAAADDAITILEFHDSDAVTDQLRTANDRVKASL